MKSIRNTNTASVAVLGLLCGLAGSLAGLTFITTASAQSCVAPPAGLAASWPGDGNAYDLIGANHGVAGPAVSFVPGKVGGAFRFTDSADSFVQLPNASIFQPTNNQLTIAAWVKPDFSGTMTALDHILAKRDGCGAEAYSYSFAIIKAYSGYPTGSFGLGMLPQIPWIASTNRIPDDGQFHHVAVTYNGDKAGGNCVLYLDGQIVGGGDGPGTIPVTSSGPTVGRLLPCGYNSQMDLDELAFFDRELSPSEIQTMFVAGSAGLCKPQCVPPPADLVGWWPGDGHSFDLVGGNHGVPYGSVSFVPAEVGRGFHFDGVSSAVFIPPSPATDVGAQAGFTVEAWLQPVISKGVVMWLGWATDGENIYRSFSYIYGDNSVFFCLIDDTTAGNWHTIRTPPDTLVPGEMQQIAFTYDKASGNAAIYRNGQVVVSQNLGTFTPATAGAQMILGRQPPSWAYEGVLDELALFKRTLSASEIAANYAARSAGMCKPCTPPPSGAVSWWSGDNHAMDLVGTNHAALKGAGGYATGEVGPAFSLSGSTNDFVEVPHNPGLNLPQFTVEAWVFVDPAANSNQTAGLIAKSDYSSCAGGFALVYDDRHVAERTNSLFFQVAGGCGTYSQPNLTGAFPSPDFYHVAGTFDGQVARLYLNGRLVATGPVIGGIAFNTLPLRIGAANSLENFGTPDRFRGLIDEVALHNRALSAEEIALHAAVVSAGQCKDFKFLAQPQNAVAYVGVSNAAMSVAASGKWPVTYQWYRGTNLLAGQTNTALTLPNPQFADAGNYTVVVSDATGAFLTSAVPATLTVKLCEEPAGGLVGWWSGDGHFLDLAGGNHGAPSGFASFAAGLVGKGFTFDGVSSYIHVTNTTTMDFGSGDFTIEGWLNFNSLAGDQEILHKVVGVVPTCQTYFLEFDTPNALRFMVYGSADNQNDLTVATSLVVGQWYHVAAVRSGNTNLLFLNGSLIGSQVAGSSANTGQGGIARIGNIAPNGVSGVTRLFNGRIDELSLYNRALSTSQVAAIYAAGSAGKCKALEILTPPVTNAVAYLGVSNAPLSVLASGTRALSYQWWHGTVLLAGQTNAALTLPNPQFADAGNYTVVVSDATGATLTSAVPATLTVRWCEPPPSGRLSWWSFDGHYADLAGDLSGSRSGSPAFVTDGEVSSALRFNGLTDWYRIDTAGLVTGHSEATVEGWVRTPGPQVHDYAAIAHEATSSGAFIYSRFGVYARLNGTLEVGWRDNDAAGYSGLASQAAIPQNTWIHFAATYKAGEGVKLYLNGVLDTKTDLPALAAFPTTVSDCVIIGNAHPTNSQYAFAGDTDELSVYTRALSASEVTAIYTASSAGKCKDLEILTPPVTNAVAYLGVSNAPLRVLASGTRTLSYQWWHGAMVLAGQTNAALTLPNPQFADAGSYKVVVTDATGSSLTSAVPAVLTVKLCEPPAAGLVAWLPGDGHFLDLTTNHNDGSPGPVVSFVPGKVGKAMRFVDSPGSEVYLPNSPLFQPANNELTIAAWVKPDFTVTGNKLDTILRKRDGSAASFAYNLSILKGHWGPGTIGDIVFTMAPTTGNIVSSKRVPDDGQFHHVAVTYDGNQPSGNCVMYLDGEVVGAADAPGPIPMAGSSVAIGRHVDDQGFYSSMDLDELGFYDRALSASEIQSLHAAGSAGQCKELRFITDLQPASQTRGVGGQASFFNLLASGTGALTYQWRHNGTPFATTSTGALTLTNLSLAEAGNYDVVVSDATSLTITSHVAVLNMVDRQPRYGCLAGLWPGEGNANDALGLYDGTLQGGAGFTNGIVGQAFSPNGGYVDLGVGPALESFTVATWVWIDPSLNTGEQRVISHDNYTLPGTRKAFMLKSSSLNAGRDGAPWFEIGAPNWQGLAGVEPLGAGWHHLAGVRDLSASPGQLELYVDGVLVANAVLAATETIDSPVSTVLSGVSSSVQIEPFLGRIDEPAIYTCALSSNEVAALYNLHPVLATQPDRTIVEQTTLTVTNAASDPGQPFNVLTYALASAPAGATIQMNTGVIVWTPTEAQGPSSNRFVTIVTDNGLPPLSETNGFSVFVNEWNLPPTLTLPAQQNIPEMVLWTGQATATDPDLPTNQITCSLVSGPLGFIVETNGAMSWTPSETDGPNTQQITVRVTDNNPLAVNGQQLTVTADFRLTINEVNRPPVPLTVPPQTIDELATLTVTNTATDPDWPANTLIYSLLVQPGNATINTNTGVITWTPTEAQGPTTNTFTVRTEDNGSPRLAATNTFTVVVNEVNSAPSLTLPATQTIDELTTLNVNATGNDGDIPANTLIYEKVGTTPTGVTVSTAGAISWTPTEAQGPSTNTVAVRVYDNGTPSLAATNSFTVIVREVNSAPTLTVPTNQFIAELTTLTVTNVASETDIPPNPWTFQLLAGPTNAVLNTNAGVFTWTPTEAQGPSSNWITVRVFDNGTPSLSTTGSFAVVVSEVNVAPVLPAIPPQVVTESQLLTVNSAATDADLPANTLTYRLLSPPAGANLDTNGVMTWTPNHAQAGLTHTITVEVTDNGTPPRSATNGFPVEVFARPAIAASLSGSKPRLVWNAMPAGRYQVQFKTRLDDADWTTVGAVLTATGRTLEFVDETAGGAESRHYRVSLLSGL